MGKILFCKKLKEEKLLMKNIWQINESSKFANWVNFLTQLWKEGVEVKKMFV